MPLRPYVLCGGGGTRLWPLSTPHRPKPLLQLPGQTGTLLDATLERMGAVSDVAPVLLSGVAHDGVVADAAPHCDRVVEPVARNTALAMVVAALHARQRGPEPVLIVPSDHRIDDVPAFAAAVRAGAEAAMSGRLVVIGVQPTHAATAYGWIERGQGKGVVPVRRFVEKPDAVGARALLTAGNHLWNAGMVLADPEVLVDEARRYVPAVVAAAEAALRDGRAVGGVMYLRGEPLQACPAVSFDVGVLERSERVSVVGADMGWSDLGSWDAVADGAGGGVVTEGDVTATGCSDSLVVQEGERPVAAIGLRDTVVVSGRRGVLVVSRGATQQVGEVAKAIAGRVRRPWGDYEVIDAGAGYAVKRLRVDPGQRTSLQRHAGRSERWTVVGGRAQVHLDGDDLELGPGEQVLVPVGSVHRLGNPGPDPLVVVEVQLGADLAEDDIVRLADDYGRA